MIENAVENYKKSIDALNDSAKLLEDSIKEGVQNAEGKDKLILENLQKDMTQLISIARKGGDVNTMINSIKKNYGYKDK